MSPWHTASGSSSLQLLSLNLVYWEQPKGLIFQGLRRHLYALALQTLPRAWAWHVPLAAEPWWLGQLLSQL